MMPEIIYDVQILEEHVTIKKLPVAVLVNQIDVTFLCLCTLFNDKLRQNIVKMAVESRAALLQKWSLNCKNGVCMHDERFSF